MTLAVRPAGTGDLAAITALEAEAFPLDPWSDNLIAQGLEGTVPTMDLLVAEVDGVFGGYAVVSVVDVDAELQRIAVPAGLQRTGVARELLRAVRAHAAGLGAERLLLEVREDNLAALLLYSRSGFTELGRRPRYYRDGATALVLSTPVTMDP